MISLKRKSFALLLPLLGILMLAHAGLASAHVTVLPKEAVQGGYETFTVRVPNEKDSATTKVEVRFQAGAVEISRFEPKPGWSYDIAQDSSGAITGVTWTAAGEGLLPTEFAQFNMLGKVSDTATSISWKAYQTYKDGTVVEWTGAPDAKTPASVTTVKPAPAAADDSSGGEWGCSRKF